MRSTKIQSVAAFVAARIAGPTRAASCGAQHAQQRRADIPGADRTVKSLDMTTRLRRVLFSAPVIATAGLFALYLAGGFFVLPAILKWQVEKQVPERLGHRVSVGAVRFNPLVFRIEVDDLALSDPDGGPMLGFRRLLADFELRSVVDRAWVFSRVVLEAPVLRVDLAKDGEHNFSTFLERLRGTEEPAQEAGALPRLVVKRVALTDGRIDYSDRLLAEPLVAHIEPVQIEIDDLSTLPSAAARYHLSASTAGGETLMLAGELGLNPVVATGTLALQEIAVATLARGLSRLVAVDRPAGRIGLAASYDLAVDSGGTVSGTVQDVDLHAAKLSVGAPGAAGSLLAMETLSLGQGRIDFGKREVGFAKVLLAKGSVAAAVDARGGIDWAAVARPNPAGPPEVPAMQTPSVTTVDGPGSANSAIASSPWRVVVASMEISDIAIDYSDAVSGRSASVARVGIDTASTIEIGPAGTRIELVSPSMVLTGAAIGEPEQSAELGEVSFQGKRITLRADAGRVDVDGEKLRGTLAAVQIAQAADGLGLRTASLSTETLSVAQANGEIRVVAGGTDASMSGLAARRGDERAAIEELSLTGRSATFSSADGGKLDLALDAIRTTASAVALHRDVDGIEIRTATLGGDSITLMLLDGRLRFAGSGARAAASGVGARQGPDRIALEDATFAAKEVSVTAGGESPDPSGVQVRVAGAALRLATVGVVAQGASSNVLRIAKASIGADSLALGVPDGPVDLTGEGLTAALSDVVMNSPANATEMARLGTVTLAGGTLDLSDRVLSAEKLAVADGSAQTWIDAQGKFNGLIVIRGLAAATADGEPVATDAPGPSAPWRLALKSAAVDGFSVGFEDRRAPPALAVGLEAIRARVMDLDTASATPMQVEIQATVAGGGEVRTRGNVSMDTGKADLEVKLADIALAPMQRYLSEIADLRLASGTVSTEGRLRYGDAAGAGARVAYEGSLAVDRLLLEEVLSKRPFLAWDSVATDDIVLTFEPNGADIGELRVDGLSGRLIIAENQTVNLTDVLKKGQAPQAAPASPRRPGEDPFPVTIARVRVAGGALDFADLSLRPQFRARMHELKGVITGLGTDADSSAKLQLDARVDRYGTARIRGRISVLDPAKLTDIDMAFRNLEMTSLSPYVVKFAGYRIAAGRLALDLQYQVDNGKLRGKNKIVLKEVSLGEKVESPGALDLPLELALAILKDADGVIDIGSAGQRRPERSAVRLRGGDRQGDGEPVRQDRHRAVRGARRNGRRRREETGHNRLRTRQRHHRAAGAPEAGGGRARVEGTARAAPRRAADLRAGGRHGGAEVAGGAQRHRQADRRRNSAGRGSGSDRHGEPARPTRDRGGVRPTPQPRGARRAEAPRHRGRDTGRRKRRIACAAIEARHGHADRERRANIGKTSAGPAAGVLSEPRPADDQHDAGFRADARATRGPARRSRRARAHDRWRRACHPGCARCAAQGNRYGRNHGRIAARARGRQMSGPGPGVLRRLEQFVWGTPERADARVADLRAARRPHCADAGAGPRAGPIDAPRNEPRLYDAAVDRAAARALVLGAEGVRRLQPDPADAAGLPRTARRGGCGDRASHHAVHREHECGGARRTRPRAAAVHGDIAGAEDRGVAELHLARSASLGPSASGSAAT